MRIKSLSILASAAALSLGMQLAVAKDTIKVGVLHSLSGTMAISETTLKDTVLMLIDEQNKKGGLLGQLRSTDPTRSKLMPDQQGANESKI